MSQNHVMCTKRTRVLNAVAAGTTDQNGTAVDMQGFEGVVFTALFGTLSATQVTKLKAQVGNLADGSDAVDLVGAVTDAMADGDSNKILVLEVHRMPPGYRYIRPVVDRGTANAVIDGVIAEQYGASKRPETESSTVSSAVVAVQPYPSDSALTATTTTPTGTTTKLVTTARTGS